MPIIFNLDPRTKILAVWLFTVLVFIVDKLAIIVVIALSFLVIRITFKMPFREIKHLKTLSMLVIFLILLQILLGKGENYILKPIFPLSFPLLGGMGSLKWDGLFTGLAIGCRLFALILILPLLASTTPPEKIAVGLAAFGLNYRIAFIITTAFNLIPLFEEEGRVIMDAQKLRGMRSFEEGSFFSRIKAYRGIVIPLMLGAMRKAQLAGIAMDSRAFGIYNKRTWIDWPVMKKRDYITVAACVIYSAVILFFNFL